MIARFDRRLGAMAAAALALVATLVVLNLRTASQLRDDVADLDRARDVQAQVQRITITLHDLETSQRGYLLTLEQPYLEPYRAGLARLDQELDTLSTASAGRPAESEEVRRVRGLIDAKRKELALTIALTEAGDVGAALRLVRENRGKAMMDELQDALGRLDALIAAEHAQRRDARSKTIERNDQLAYLLMAALAILLPVILAMVRRQSALQARIRDAETAAREALEQRVAERTAELHATAKQLALSADRLRGIVDSASEGIVTTDAAQVIVDANPASARMFHCEVSDLIGAPLERLIPVRFRDAHRHSVEAFGAGAARSRHMLSQAGGRVVTALRFDGEEFLIEASISRTDVGGQRLYTVIHRDVTEQLRAAAILQHSQRLMAATFDASSVAMAQIDPATRRFVAVNQALCRLSGYTEPELLAMSPDDLSHPDDRLGPAMLGAQLRGDPPCREQKRLLRKDGATLWIEISGSVVRDAQGHAERVVGFLQDITARRQADDALRAGAARQAFLVHLNDRLRDIEDPQAIAYEASCLLGEFVHADRVGYAQDDGNGDTITVARNYTRDVPGIEGRYRYVDYGVQLLAALQAGRTVVRPDIARDPSLSDSEKAAHAVLQLGATVNVPLLRDSQLNAVFFVHAVAARAWSDDDVALFEDVARRIRADITRAGAQAAERAASAKLAAALESMNDAVFICDTQGNFVEFNTAFATFHRFGSKAECLRTLPEYPGIFEVFMADGTPLPLENWAVPRALRGEVGSTIEYGLRRKDTGESWVGSYSFAPVRAQDGRIVGSVVTCRDVTALKRTQADLATSHAALQHLIASQQRAQEDERKRIARELHDDLQQSLAAIRMDAVAVGDRLAKGRRDIEPLLARIDRLSEAAIASTRRIVSDLRPEMLEELGLLPALEALCAEHAQRSGSDCRFERTGTDPAARLDDPVLSIGLYRIAQEALNNAAKHARASVVRVQIEVTRHGLVRLRVADNGVGLHARVRRDPASFGLLGMSERVRAMGGQLRIESEHGQGTVVEVLLPMFRAAPAADAPAARADDPPGSPSAAAWGAWGQPLQAVIDALDGNVAVLDREGRIQLVNGAWRAFAAQHGAPDLRGCGPGVNYLEVCRRSAADDASVRVVLQGMAAVLEGRDRALVIEYPCATPDRVLWFRMHAATIIGGSTIVSHVAINGPGERSAATGDVTEQGLH